jgi:hypothetical protein
VALRTLIGETAIDKCEWQESGLVTSCPICHYPGRMLDLATIAMLVVSLAVAHGANARIARLIAEDEITEPWRAWLIKHLGSQHLLTRWAHCPWCAGWWTAWPVTAAAWFPIMNTQLWGLYFLAAWSVAHAAGRLNNGS